MLSSGDIHRDFLFFSNMESTNFMKKSITVRSYEGCLADTKRKKYQ
jgi:hypothetical protein